MLRETLSVRIPVWLGEWLDTVSYDSESSKSDLVNAILKDYHDRQFREADNDEE